MTLKVCRSLRLAICTGDRLAQNTSYPCGEGFSGMAAVAQQAWYTPQVWLAAYQGLQGTFAVGHFRCRHRNGMG